jgi:hypothetical protein
MKTEELAERLLEFIESDEAYLSQVGVLDPWTTPDSLQHCWPHGHDELYDSIESLVGDGRLIWLRSFSPDGQPNPERAFGERRYRSRLAETFRLIWLVRQRFPKRDFEASPDLVTGLCWYALPRFTPMIEGSYAAALRANVEPLADTPGLRQAIDILAEAWEGEQLSGFQERALQTLTGHITVGRRSGSVSLPAGRGVVVQAPTGAGKTRAFFMPALLEPVLRRLEPHTSEPGCSILAMYPRTALASDQLMAVLPLVRSLNKVLERNGLTPVTIGVAWTGQLHHWPPSLTATRDRWVRSSARGGGWSLPFLRCFKCGEPLYAPESPTPPDLECRMCQETFPEIKYVWEGYVQRSPDLLVAVTQTLHLRLTSTQYSNVFGRSSRRGPSLVLLDEVHLYGGLFGAQVASLIRRVRRRLSANDSTAKPPMFVGLSATLELAVPFFSRLTGIDPSAIEGIEPAPQELRRSGTEAVGFVRASRQPPPLATAIQSAMVVGHSYLRDTPDVEAPERAFFFCDNIDLVHRLAFQLRDAEEQQKLFQLRLPGAGFGHQLTPPHDCSECRAAPDAACGVFLAGECWWFASNTSERPLSVSAASSLSGDPGRARITVTSPTLEVGIDDRSVLSTMQYLAPPSPSNLIQRRGRAGRSRGSRPLSLLILSQLRPADMFVFRNPSSLVSPALPPIPMNPGNMLARRTHAFAGILDRFAMSSYARGQFGLDTRVDAATLRAFAGWISGERDLARDVAALWSDATRGGATMERLLWSKSTGLFTALLPHFLHRDSVNQTPLQRLEDFLPGPLYSELKVPDFIVRLPWSGDEEERREEIDIALAMTLPGNVTYRYSPRGQLPVWVPRSPFPEDRSVAAEHVYDLRDTGIMLRPDVLPRRRLERVRSGPPNATLRLVRPLGLSPGVLAAIRTQLIAGGREPDVWSVTTGQPPTKGRTPGAWIVIDSRTFAVSRHWVERDSETGPPIDLLGVDANGLKRTLGGVQGLATSAEAYLVDENGGLVSCKATIGGSSYGTLRKGRDTQHVVSEFGFVRRVAERMEDVALGWSGRVDGLCFRFSLARAREFARQALNRDRRLHNDIRWKILSREFLQLVQESRGNVFDAERALEVVATAILAGPSSEGGAQTDFMEVVKAAQFDDDNWSRAAIRTWHDLHAITVATAAPEDEAGEGEAADFACQGDELERWLNDHADNWRAAVGLMEDRRWLQTRIDEIVLHTFARMLRVAALRNSGAGDARDFLASDAVDVEEVTDQDERDVFVFETALEGAGLCQSLVARLNESPELFGDQVAAVAQDCPRATEDEFVREVVRLARMNDQARDLLVAAERVHDIDALADLQRQYRELFREPLLDWQVKAFRTKSLSVAADPGTAPNWWEISADLVCLDDELTASYGITPSVELLVWAAIRRSRQDDSLPAVRALRKRLGERLSGDALESTLAPVLERFALRGCTDGCPDCVTGLPDEVEQSQRTASLLVSRSLAAAVIEESWAQESVVLTPDETPAPDSIATWLLAACRRGESEASIIVAREHLGIAIELLERATGSGMPIGLKTAPVAIRAARRMSGGRVQLVVGLAE